MNNIYSWRVISIAIFTVFQAFLLTSCGNSNNAVTQKSALDTKNITSVIKLATIDVPPIKFITDFAVKNWEFKKNNVDVNIMNVANWTDTLLMNGAVDAKIWATSNVLWMYLNNQTPVVVWNLFKQFSSTFFSRFPSWEFSKIKNVNVNRMATDPFYFTVAWLKNNKVDTSKINFVAFPSDNLKIQKLKKGEIDFATITDFKISSKEKTPFLAMSLSDDKVLDWYDFSFSVIANKKNLDKNKDWIQKLVKSLYATIDYALANKDESIAFIQKDLWYSKELAVSFYNNFELSAKNQDRITNMDKLNNMKELILPYVKPKNPTRDLKDFVYPDFVNAYTKK